jgi:hypothetical protein
VSRSATSTAKLVFMVVSTQFQQPITVDRTRSIRSRSASVSGRGPANPSRMRNVASVQR